MSRTTWVADAPPDDRHGYGTLTRSGAAFQPPSPAGVCQRPPRQRRQVDSHDPADTTAGALPCPRFSLSPLRSPLLGASRLLSSRPGTEMFQFPGCPPVGYGFPDGCAAITRHALPHSEITGSGAACASPVHFVARHVLHRHWFPEHPPYAACSLTARPSAHRRPHVRPSPCPLRASRSP